MEKLLILIIFGLTVALCNAEDPSAHIIGGRDAFPGRFPYMVSLRYTNSIVTLIHGCGGAILNERWILTAAHCYYYVGRPQQIIAGTVRRDGEGGDRYDVTEIHVHPLFPPTVQHQDYNFSNWHDIGLLKVDRPITFNRFVQPISLVRRRVIGNTRATISGFGFKWIDNNDWTNYTTAPIMQFTRIDVITNSECSIRTRLLGPLEPRYPTANIYPGHICTQAPRGVGICFGDTGSPLVTRDGVIGVAVGGIMLCGRGAPDLYVRVSTYFSWINSHINDLS